MKSFDRIESGMSRDTRARLLATLADGRFHSGQDLADRTGISRTAIWKHMRALEQRGLDVFAVTGRGYRLAEPLDLLDIDHIRAHLAVTAAEQVNAVTVEMEMASTNQFLLERLPADQAHGHVCLAEYQSAGQGRHGNRWQSPLAAGLYLSVGWRAEGMAEPLTGLSLAAGVAAVRALKACGVTDVGLKWPNDLISQGRKLGGILLQVRGEITGSCLWVLGIGINVRLPAAVLEAGYNQPVTDLHALAPVPPARSELAAVLINELIACLSTYPQTGFKPYIRDWQRHDCMSGRDVTLSTGQESVRGQMIGVDNAGALLLSIDGAVQRYASGELSLRAAS